MAPGTGVKEAAVRKLEQEIGITTLVASDFQFLARIHYKAAYDETWGEHEIDHILMMKSEGDDVPYACNPNEVSEAMYVDQNELKALMDDDSVLITPWFK
jgi:isopentenyl-diphosphate delta-isomerase